MNFDYSVTFATYNASHFTKQCVESLVRTGTPLERLVVVDNASSDDTREYLATLPLGGRIFNHGNFACGVAWNQGILHFQSEWTIVMNNDLLVSSGWVEDLIGTAIAHNLKIIAPARVDGELDYDFEAFSAQARQTMGQVLRSPAEDAVCMCIHRSVFQEVGFFRATPRMLGFEDAIFFHDVRKAKVARGITGKTWLHHFGSVTQKWMKKSMGLRESDDLVQHNDRRILNQGWLERKLERHQRKKLTRQWRDAELKQYGMTLFADRFNGEFHWR